MKLKVIVAMMMLVPALYACEKQGPLERAGEKIDDTIGDAKAGHKTTQSKIDDAAHDLRKAGEDISK